MFRVFERWLLAVANAVAPALGHVEHMTPRCSPQLLQCKRPGEDGRMAPDCLAGNGGSKVLVAFLH